MKNIANLTPMLPGFYMPLRGRKPRSAQQLFADKLDSFKRKSFKQIGEIFGQYISEKYLKPTQSGVMSRRSIFSKENTFWAFLGQIIDADGSCKEVVRKLQSYASLKGIRKGVKSIFGLMIVFSLLFLCVFVSLGPISTAF